MKLYMNLGQRVLEEWLIQTAGDRIQICSYDESEYVLVHRLHEAQAAHNAGKTVLFVAGQDKEGKTKSQKAKQLGLERALHWTWREKEEAASLILTFLLKADQDLPAVELRDEPLKIVIRSTPRAGGSFLAWNLYALLSSNGINAELQCAKSGPFPKWGVTALVIDDENVKPDSDADVWILDASGAGDMDVPGDVLIFVQDIDPAFPATQDSKWRVVNRVPASVEGDFHDAQLVLPDYGIAAYHSMKKGEALSLTCELLAEALWNFWNALKVGKNEVRIVASDVQFEVDALLEETDTDESKSDSSFDDDSESGFVLDL